MESIPIEEMKKVFETNVFGVIRMIKEVMPDMKRRRGGHIIVVSSVMGLQGEQRRREEGGGVGEDVKWYRGKITGLSASCVTKGLVDDGHVEEWVEVKGD